MKLKYEVEVRFRPSIPDKVKHWKFFKYDQETRRFLEVVEEFDVLNIDQDENLMKDDVDLQDTKNLQKHIVDHHSVAYQSTHTT